MVKQEIKVEFDDTQKLENLIQKTYFEDGFKGKILSKKHFISVGEDSNLYDVFKGLDNATVRLLNNSVDGSIRVLVDESEGEIRLYPISIYCVKEEENDRYSFY